MKAKGKVYLVGAGPGDPGLMTVKAADLLQACDAVVYDRLCPLEWVVGLPPRVKRYYVGKSSSKHSLKQDQINALLGRLARQEQTVVRLKGGDPFVFGRGGEEAVYLRERDMPFEVIPGVTAGLAAAACAGIPATHRGTSVFVLLLTAHETPDKSELQVPWDWVGQARQGTVIGYMGVKQLPMVVENLLAAGFRKDLPAAIIERGTSGVQRVVKGRLQNLPRLAEQKKIAPPAVFVIGEVVALSPALSWFGQGILAGQRVMVTRPASQAAEMYSLLRGQGAEVLPLPTISIEENHRKKDWSRVKSTFSGKEVLAGKTLATWLVFTSENGVRYFLAQLFQQGFDYRSLGGLKIAAVGSGTSRELQRHHLKADFLPSQATTMTLAKELAREIAGNPVRIIRVRGNLGDDRVERALAEAGAEVLPLQVYTTRTACWDAGMWALLEENPPEVITFTSGSTVTGFIEILGWERARELARGAVIASIGPSTTEVIRDCGLRVSVEARSFSIGGLVEALIQHFKVVRKKGRKNRD